MNDRQVLQRARELCGDTRHEQVISGSYREKHGEAISDTTLSTQINALKTRGKVPPHLREKILAEKTATRAQPSRYAEKRKAGQARKPLRAAMA